MKQRKRKKAITILTTISIIITLAGLAFDYVIPKYLTYRFNLDANTGSSIGVIGGADGPTAIFLTGSLSPGITTIVFALLSMAGIVYLVLSRKTRE
ncbi:MAG: sodium ion-translocating decarboxylase subunit beta [Syntrophomonadales bacterium]